MCGRIMVLTMFRNAAGLLVLVLGAIQSSGHTASTVNLKMAATNALQRWISALLKPLTITKINRPQLVVEMNFWNPQHQMLGQFAVR